MNREQRRRQQRAARQHRTRTAIHVLAETYECPDCLADTELVHEAPGLYRLNVMHDSTCPTYRAMGTTN